MREELSFRSGKDLDCELRTDDEETVTCEICGRTEADEAAHETGWNLVPIVCPDCIHWEASVANGEPA